MIEPNPRTTTRQRSPPTDDPEAAQTPPTDPDATGAPGNGNAPDPAASGEATPGSGESGGGAAPGPVASAPASSSEAPGLRGQLGATKDAAFRLLRAHRDLARAELDQILDEVKRLAVLAGVALAALVLLGILVPVGLTLFMGEWLFGSIGWGLLHGTLFLLAVALLAAFVALGSSGASVGRGLIVAVVIGVVVGVLFALDLPNAAWARLGESAGLGVDPSVRPLVVGVIVLALAGALLGAVIAALVGGSGATLGGLFGGAVLGALFGAFSAITFGVQAGAAVGVSAGLIAWPVVSGIGLARMGIDMEALKARFWPSVTIDTAKETIEWVRSQSPLGPKP